MANTTPTTVPPGTPTGSGLAHNKIAQAAAAAAGVVSNPQDSDTSRFGLTTTELGTPISAQSQSASAATMGVLPPTGGAPDIDPFGIGIPIQTTGGMLTAQDLVDYIQRLPPAQLAQVQSELANAGFYGTMNSVSDTPHWGLIGNADLAAISAFTKTVINGAQSGSSIQSILARSTQQFSTQQMKSKTPVNDLGKNYTITNLDPQQAQDMVDQAAMSTIGRTLSPDERAKYAAWLNQQNVAQQMKQAQGDIAQSQTNAMATAQASDTIDPTTGQAIGGNKMVTAAQSQLGVKYVWGGESPGAAFDCSGLAQWAAKQAGITLPRTSQAMWNQGPGQKFNDMSQAQPGDLVFFGGDGTGPTHVGIYIGNGMMIDAPHTGASVRYDNVQSFGQSDSIAGFMHIGAGGGAPAQTTAAQTGGGAAPQGDLDRFMSAEKQVESGGDYTVTNSIGAGGAYQMLPSTWNQYAAQAGYSQYVGKGAASAPPDVQDAVASFAFRQLYNTYHDWGQVAQAWYGGPGGVGKSYTQAYAQDVLSKMGTMAKDAVAPGIKTVDQSGNITNLDMSLSGLQGTAAASAGTPDANGGRSIIQTPNTFTNVQEMTQADMQAELAAKIRADHPDEATGADWAGAYEMLKKAIDPRGFTGGDTTPSTTTGG